MEYARRSFESDANRVNRVSKREPHSIHGGLSSRLVQTRERNPKSWRHVTTSLHVWSSLALKVWGVSYFIVGTHARTSATNEPSAR
nr:hypothetical protein CFP56_65230 [Quercus suber]